MRFSLPSRDNKGNDAQLEGLKFTCKECKMMFQSKESLEIHKKKARHFTGSIYFGKQDG